MNKNQQWSARRDRGFLGAAIIPQKFEASNICNAALHNILSNSFQGPSLDLERVHFQADVHLYL